MRNKKTKFCSSKCSEGVLARLSIIWSSPLSDYHRVAASNQYALLVLTYFMWTQTWPLADLQLDREAREVIVENGGNHPLGLVAQLYSSRKNGARGHRSVEAEYKSTKIKAAVKLFENSDTTMSAVRKFEEKAVQTGCHQVIKDQLKNMPGSYNLLRLYSILIQGLLLEEDGDEIGGKKLKTTLAKAQQKAYCDTLGLKRNGKGN